MTSVNVTTQKNTVTVQQGDATTVTVTTQGAQGATGATGATGAGFSAGSVKDFGVTGDGSTDDGANIQIAIDAAANKTLYFPSGTYKITDRQITINNPIHIIGDGKSTVLQSTIADNSSVGQCFKIRSSNVTFEDISIDSRNGDADGGDVTILIQSNTTAGFINDTLFKNVHITGGNTLQTSGNRVGRPCNHGVKINDTTNVRRLRIDSCHWEKLNIGFFTSNDYGNPTNGDISCRDVTVINSSFTDFGKRPFVFNSDFSTSGKTFAHDGIKIVGCHFARLIGQDLDQRCTYLGGDGVRNLTVTGCQFRDLHTEPNDGVIHVENHGDNLVCTNNTFLNCAGGITFYSLSTKAIITNNIILGNTRRRQKVKVVTSKVSTANNTIEIEGHEYETGDPIVYDKGGHPTNTVITGLSSGTTYNVIKVDEKLFKLATSYNNALAGTAINLTGTGNNSQTFGSEPSYFPEEAMVATSAVSTANDTITISNHGYHTKDSILYENGGGTSITGLTSGQVYYVVKIDANTFKLALTLSNAAALSPTTLDLTGTGNNAQIFTPYAKDFGSNGILLIVNSDGSADRTIVSNNIIEGFHKGIDFSGDDTTHEISDNLINLCTYGLKITSLNKAFIATRNRVSNSKYFADVLPNASVTLSNNICEECSNVFTSTITGSRNNIVKNFKIIKTITDYVGGQTPSSSPSSFRTLMQAPTFGKGQFIARLFETVTPDDECVAIADYEFAAADGSLTLSNYQRVNQGSVGLNATGSNSFRINSNNFEVSAFSAITQYLTWEISFTGNLVFTDNSTVSGATTTVDNYGTKELFFSDVKKAEATVDGFSINGDLAVSGNMTVSGTVDGRDVATDGTKLDGVETGATADQTAAEIKTLLDSNGIVNSNVDASAAIAGTKISPNFGSQNILTQGNFTINSASPQINLNDTENNPDYRLSNSNGIFKIRDTTNSLDRFKINAIGDINISNSLIVTGNAIFGGNLTVSGTTTTIDTTTLTVEDKNIELGKVGSPTDITANLGGISLLGDTTKTFQWLNATDSWTSSEHIALPDNKKLQLGDSQDLAIFHNSTDSFIENITGNLHIRPKAGVEGIKLVPDANVQLFYDGILAAQTVNGGLNVIGTVIRLRNTSNNGDLIKLFHSGTGGNGLFTSEIGDIKIQPNEDGGTVKLFETTNGTTTQRLATTNNGVTISGNLFGGNFNAATDGNTSISLQDTGHGFSASEVKLSNGGRDLNIVAPKDIRLFTQGGENAIVCEANAQIELYFNGVKKAATSSTGLDVTGDVKASTGILFGTDTSDDNKLQDYEEGTWLPTVVSEGTIGTPQYTCTYTKIGRLVTINADIHQLSDTTSDSHILIGGLPYVPTRTNGNWQAVCQGERYGHKDIIVAYLLYTGGAWRIGFRYGVPLNHFSYVKHSNISDDGSDNNLRFTLTYELAS